MRIFSKLWNIKNVELNILRISEQKNIKLWESRSFSQNLEQFQTNMYYENMSFQIYLNKSSHVLNQHW